ncbi:uncharacterized protein LOC143204565 [Rhynchophorus ferrugineus]|uniref:N-terminal methionine N(alpha)-acetyltransferase NatC n=1 Tax=Rhynchophorus ferrugineus TaxID=354439 RepID=A0A834HQK7_RHYFE|nr:hypothetical protein GWI33_021192 [Rhynchophorus ferrugineus]
MSTIVSESNLVDKCHSKIVDKSEARDGTKNGLVNGIVLTKKQKEPESIKSDIIENCKDISVDTTLVKESDIGNIQVHNVPQELVKSKKKSKKKKLKSRQLDSNENLNGTKIETNSHIESDDLQDESLDNSDSNVINEVTKTSSPSCSTKNPNQNNDMCDPLYLSNALDNLVVSKIDDISNEQEKKCEKNIKFVQYESELQMPMIMKIIQKDLSEPYSIYTYRYFIHNWPKLCFLAMCEDQCVGAIVCKLDLHRKVIRRGYIAMLAVDQNFRKLRIGSTLVQMAIHEMTMGDADEVVLETEVTNKPALKLYEKLGFVRDKRLFRYYLNGVDALRLKLWLR